MTTTQTTAATMTAADFRNRFEGLDRLVHLASCSQGAVSDLLVQELAEYHQTLVEQGAAWGDWMVKVARARELFAAHIGADLDEIAVVPSASEGAYQVASTQDWSVRPRVVTTDMEFPSVAQVWLAQQPRGAVVDYVAERLSGDAWSVDAQDYADLVDERTALVSVPLISYRNGLRLPVADVIAQARSVGARTFVDAYQGLGVEPVDVHELGCDYLVGGTLKYLLGIPGIAFLYVRAGLTDPVPPSLTGWFGRIDPFSFDPRTVDHPTHARRFEAGTPSVPSAYGAVGGLRMLEQVDLHDVRAHVSGLTGRLTEELLAMGRTLRSPHDDARRGPQVALVDADPVALDAALREQGIGASPRGEVLRMSFHYYNDDSDVDAVVAAIRQHAGRD